MSPDTAGGDDVDAYVAQATGWPAEITAVREVLVDCDLTEQLKWRQPCYSHEGRNIVILQEMKDFLALMFFKGALLRDPEGVLVEQGPNSRSARRIEITSVDDVHRLADVVRAYVAEAIDVEDAGLDVGPAPEPEPAPELAERLDADAELRAAFEALTPGRRREYHLHISGAKQSATRAARVERCVPRILAGKGLRR